ncbi:hypothetical protein BZA77DRAFT_45479 [Pyronema omphalodes]|nr:hypothetical protein BZA77DRAFT_45479 [Pyronema omphalodes]
MSKTIRNLRQQPLQRPRLIRRDASTNPRELQMSSHRLNQLMDLRAPENHTPTATAVQTMANQFNIAVIMIPANPNQQYQYQRIAQPGDEMNISVPVPVRGRDHSGVPAMGMDSHQVGNVDNTGTVVRPSISTSDNANAITNQPENVQSDTENVQSDTENVQSDTENVQSDTENVQSDTENIQSDTENVQSDTENIQSDTENVQSDTENVQSESDTIQADSEAFQSESDDIGSKTDDFGSEPDEFNTETKAETVRPNTENPQPHTETETEAVP